MIFVQVPHPEREDLRMLLCADVNDGLPDLKHFYLEKKLKGEDWKRTRKIKRDYLDKYLIRFGFDQLEALFLLDEFAENYEGDD